MTATGSICRARNRFGLAETTTSVVLRRIGVVCILIVYLITKLETFHILKKVLTKRACLLVSVIIIMLGLKIYPVGRIMTITDKHALVNLF